jgi:ribonuclease BN (tRNA processing enzyme)
MCYLSPPLFPVSVRELLTDPQLHELPSGTLEFGEFTVTAHLVIHLNPTLGYRIQGPSSTLTFLPDHQPALGTQTFPQNKEWTSGYGLAEGTDLLIHDAQYTDEEYQSRIGFGHSSIRQAFQFAELTGAKQLVPFHHDPTHNDDMLDQMIEEAVTEMQPGFRVTPGKESLVLDIGEYGY